MKRSHNREYFWHSSNVVIFFFFLVQGGRGCLILILKILGIYTKKLFNKVYWKCHGFGVTGCRISIAPAVMRTPGWRSAAQPTTTLLFLGEGQGCSIMGCRVTGAQPTSMAALCGPVVPSLLRTLSGIFMIFRSRRLLSCALPSGWTHSLDLLTCILFKVTVSKDWVGSHPTGAERWGTVGQDTLTFFWSLKDKA